MPDKKFVLAASCAALGCGAVAAAIAVAGSPAPADVQQNAVARFHGSSGPVRAFQDLDAIGAGEGKPLHVTLGGNGNPADIVVTATFSYTVSRGDAATVALELDDGTANSSIIGPRYVLPSTNGRTDTRTMTWVVDNLADSSSEHLFGLTMTARDRSGDDKAVARTGAPLLVGEVWR
jgi:hypothetical protein